MKMKNIDDQFDKWGMEQSWGMDLTDWGIGLFLTCDWKWKDFAIQVHIGPFWGRIGLWTIHIPHRHLMESVSAVRKRIMRNDYWTDEKELEK